MATWGISTSDESKPKYLNTADKANCWATEAGWVLRHPNGIVELLVAIGDRSGLAALLGNPNVDAISILTRSDYGDPFKFIVHYNEAVNVSGIPYFTLTGDNNLSANVNFTSYFPDANVTSSASLLFTSDISSNVYSDANIIISATLTANGATILDAVNTSVNAAIDFANAGANGQTDVRPSLANILIDTYTLPIPLSATLSSRSSNADNVTIIVNYNTPLFISGDPFINISDGANFSGNAEYVAGSTNTAAITFTLVPAANTNVSANLVLAGEITSNGATIADASNTAISAYANLILAGPELTADIRPDLANVIIINDT